MAWGLPSNLQDRLIADALHGGFKVPSDLPASISGLAVQQAISNAFVSGLHAASVLVASVALLAAALLILAFVKQTGIRAACDLIEATWIKQWFTHLVCLRKR